MPNAIITGGTQGIGKAIAEKLLSEGFSVCVCSRDKKKLHLLEEEWNDKYPTASVITVVADLTRQEDVSAFADTALANFEEVDILVNNIGIYQPGSIVEEQDGMLETMLQTNLFVAYHLTRKVAPVMKSAGAGHIFTTCSTASLEGGATGGAYSISKYALKGFSDNLREELKEFGVKVTAIYPGSTYTPSWDGSNVSPGKLLETADIATMLWGAYKLSPQANVDTIILRPVKNDL